MDFGAFVDLGGIDGLVHVSELSFRRVRNANELVKVGDVLDVAVLKVDREAQKLSLSLKQARGNDPWLDAAAKYAVMTPVTGRVTKIENFGAFIEVEEGIEGLLPVSEISYQRINHPTDRIKENDTLRLVVLSVDAAARRMSFSLKQAGPDPWKTVNERYQTDSVVPGTVTRVADFGALRRTRTRPGRLDPHVRVKRRKIPGRQGRSKDRADGSRPDSANRRRGKKDFPEPEKRDPAG